MKKGVNKKEAKTHLWLLDGFVGILALMIYNFVLYLFSLINIGGIIRRLDDATGYFCINSFSDFGFTATQIAIGLIMVFAFSFLLGILIGKQVRKKV